MPNNKPIAGSGFISIRPELFQRGVHGWIMLLQIVVFEGIKIVLSKEASVHSAKNSF